MNHSDSSFSSFWLSKNPIESRIKLYIPKISVSSCSMTPSWILSLGGRTTRLTTFRTEIISFHQSGCVLFGAGWLAGLTAHASEASKKECLAAGMDAFVSKVGVEGGGCIWSCIRHVRGMCLLLLVGSNTEWYAFVHDYKIPSDL